MDLLVAGGAGFIGANFAHLIAGRGHRAVVLDALTYAANPLNLQGIPDEQVRLVHGDIRDRALVDSVLAEGIAGAPFAAVINFAAESHVDRSISDAMPFVETNVLGAVTLVEAARRANVPTFVQISTDEVYGSIEGSGTFDLASPLAPSSAYSASKAAADLLLMSYYRTHGYDVRVTRCTNNYGRFQHAEKLIPTIIQKALAREPIPIYGDGLQVRDWIHVDDHCEGILAVVERGVAGHTYHFGGRESEGTGITNLELTRKILRVIARQTNSQIDELERLITHVTDRAGHDRRYALDWSTSQEQLGWQPKQDLERGLESTVQWYLNRRQ